jgi:MFS family permease
VERRERARAIGLWGASGGAAIALGPIAGGWLPDRFSWSSIFVAMGPVAFAAVVLAAAFVPATRGDGAGRLDVGGLVSSAAAIGVLVFTIIEAPSYGWASARSLADFAAAAILLLVFVLSERRFTSAPATESIMGAIAARTAGVGSAVNDTTRLVGGTLGVAVIGSVYASLYQHRMGGLLGAGVPGGLVQISRQSVGAGLAVAQHLAASGQTALGQILTTPRPEGRGFQPSQAGVPVSQPTAPGRTRSV